MAERLDKLGTIVRKLSLSLDEYLSAYEIATNKWRDKTNRDDETLGAIARVYVKTLKYEALKFFDFSDSIFRGDFGEAEYEALRDETWLSVQFVTEHIAAINKSLPDDVDTTALTTKFDDFKRGYGEFCLAIATP